MEITAAEVKFSRIARNRAHLDRVGDFAKMLERDHTQTSIEGLRQKPGTDITAIIPLSKKHEKKVDQLSQLSGEEFDRMFIDAIIKDHKDAVGLLESLTESDKQTRAKARDYERAQQSNT